MMYGHTQVAPQAAGKPLYAAACLAYSDLTLTAWCVIFATRFQLWNFKQLLHLIEFHVYH